ncbi:MAG: asparagine synthase-related protein, partial [Bdellovibrionota bacterium]
LGEKPLYYGWIGKTFLFGSELKALRAHPGFRGEIDRAALALMLRYSYIPAPYSIYKGIHKLKPGHILRLTQNRLTEHGACEITSYWSVELAAQRGVTHRFEGTEAEATQEMDNLLRDAIRHQMIADVPLGAFLSGGIDSSLVVALMQAQSTSPVKTFAIGFEETGYNEAVTAKMVAAHLGTEHTELYVTSAQALTVIPTLPTLYDEPFADPSQIPTFLLAQLARRHVTVSLSGDGGDELFGGYNRYVWTQRIWRSVRWMPYGMRRVCGRGLQAIPPFSFEQAIAAIQRFLPSSVRHRQTADKLYKLGGIFMARSQEEAYRTLVSHWHDLVAPVLEDNTSAPIDLAETTSLPNFIEYMM